MSLPIPLAVRLSSRADRHVTLDVRDLTIRSTDPGGFASCQVSLDRPLTFQPDEVVYYGGLTVYDGRSAAVVFDGRLEDPGRSAGDGQVYDIAAVGGQAHTLDKTHPLVYVDKQLSPWTEFARTSATYGKVSVGEDEDIYPGEPSVLMTMPNGSPLTTNAAIRARYLPIAQAGQKLARFRYKWDTGRTSASLRVISGVRTAASWASSGNTVRNDAANTAGQSAFASEVGTDFTAGKDTLELVWTWTGAPATVADDVTWVAFADIVVVATRFDKAGNEMLTGADYSNSTVLASEVVADLLGRQLPDFDGANAVVAATSYDIDQLAYYDGVNARKVLEDLMALEAGYTWRVWERGPNGYRFEWTTIPTDVRYEATIDDGYDSQGSADGLFNQVTVRYKDGAGIIRTVLRTASSPILTAAGKIRRGMIDLGDEVGSLAGAQRAGDQWLLDRVNPPNAGRLRIARPILDHEAGRMVMPWEIRPGLIRVRGINPRVDALNASSRDGVTIFRIVATEFRASDGAATLELDSYAPTTARTLAQLSRRPVFRRR